MIKIEKPTLIVDKQRVRRNIEQMVVKTKKSNVVFRPHFKTHQSLEIGEWFKDFGVNRISVSSVDMAEYFCEKWNDITVAIPVNINQIHKINRIAKKTKLNLVVESQEAIRFLTQKISKNIDVWIEIDVGYPRTGINWQYKDRIEEILSISKESSKLDFVGLIAHFGNTYDVNSISKIEQIYSQSISRITSVRDHLHDKGFSNIKISVGDTPSCSVLTDFSDIDEIRPGNFVFYDLTQVNLGSCQENNVAIAVATPVIAKFPTRKQIVIYGGTVHLSKEFLIIDNGRKIYGKIALPDENGWSKTVKDAYIINLSQEHGVITADRNLVNELQIGDTLFILPVHSCITANLYKHYKTLEGKTLSNIHSGERS